MIISSIKAETPKRMQLNQVRGKHISGSSAIIRACNDDGMLRSGQGAKSKHHHRLICNSKYVCYIKW